ncbi:hypothetical protein NE865_00920 [Phthorimaea operculella]|nr:hypothetical protein NE865_00920 [Phthorimaea operculella]
MRRRYRAELDDLYSKRPKKPEWTRKRIREVIHHIEDFTLAPRQNRKRTAKSYYFTKIYEVKKVAGKKILVPKRKSIDDFYWKIVPSEEYFDILLEAHKKNKRGSRRDGILKILSAKHLKIPRVAVECFLKVCLCAKCVEARKSSRNDKFTIYFIEDKEDRSP